MQSREKHRKINNMRKQTFLLIFIMLLFAGKAGAQCNVIITDPAAVCSPETVDLTAESVTFGSTPGLTFTYWTDPSATISYPTPAAATDGIYYIKGDNLIDCFEIKPVTVTVNSLPATPGAISGTATQCGGLTGQIYSITAVTGATTYTWTVPTGWSVTGGAGTTSITVTTGSAGQNGNITATAGNSCGTSSPRSLAVTVSSGTPNIPGAISGTATQCGGLTGQIYSITAVTGATTYTWTVPTGWSVTGGAGTTSITVTTGSAGQNGNITATAGNSCGTSSPRSLAVTVSSGTPNIPGAISGTATQCGGLTGQIYSITAVTGATTYTWTVPTGWSVAGGAGTTSIAVTTGSAGQNGNITVTAGNSCGTSSPRSISVTVTAVPATPGAISGTATQCGGLTGQIYSITAVTGATTYTWTVPTGWSVTGGAGTTSITVTTGSAGQNGNITVTAGNICGTSSASSLSVTVRPTPTATISGTTAVCQNATVPNITFTNPQTLPITITYNINGSNQSTINVGASTTANVGAPTNAAGTYAYNLVSVVYQTGPVCSNTITGTATVTINPIPTPTLPSSAPGNVSCQGTSVTFTAGGGTNYDFRVGGVTVQNSLLTTYTTTSLADGQIVNVIVTNNVTGCSAISTDIHNIVHSLPYIVVTTPTTCSTDYLTYSVGVTVTPGATVTCTSGLVTNIGTNVWTITGILAHTNVNIIVTDSNGCINTLPVTAPDCNCPVVLAPVSGGDKSYCASGVIPAINATVLTGETVDWYNSSSGGTLLKSGSLRYTPTAPGTYYALARNTTSNCVSSTRTPVAVTMNPLPIPTLTSSDPDNIFCAGTSVIFTATGGTNYNFLVEGSSVQNGVSATYTTSTLTNGQRVNVIVTNANGCTATAAQIINTVNPTPTPTLTSSDADNSFCAGTSITFTAGGGSAYDFRVGGVSVQSGVSATYTTNTLTNGQVVNVIVSNANGCTATSSGITNTVNALPIPTITSSDADNIFCAGTSVTFTATGGTTYNFRVAGVIVQNGTSATYTTNSLTNGQIVDVIAANSTGCNVTSSGITNTVNPQPTANAGTGGTACNLNFNFNAVPNIGIGTWTKTSGPGTATYAPNANTANAAVTVSEYGTYSFTWTEVSGQCSSSSTITVNFNLQPVASPGTGGNNCGLGFHLMESK